MKNIKSILLLIVIASISMTTIAQKITFVEPRFNLESPKPEISSFDLNGKPVNSFMIDETMNGAEPNYLVFIAFIF